jgi:hypothetical protein
MRFNFISPLLAITSTVLASTDSVDAKLDDVAVVGALDSVSNAIRIFNGRIRSLTGAEIPSFGRVTTAFGYAISQIEKAPPLSNQDINDLEDHVIILKDSISELLREIEITPVGSIRLNSVAGEWLKDVLRGMTQISKGVLAKVPMTGADGARQVFMSASITLQNAIERYSGQQPTPTYANYPTYTPIPQCASPNPEQNGKQMESQTSLVAAGLENVLEGISRASKAFAGLSTDRGEFSPALSNAMASFNQGISKFKSSGCVSRVESEQILGKLQNTLASRVQSLISTLDQNKATLVASGMASTVLNVLPKIQTLLQDASSLIVSKLPSELEATSRGSTQVSIGYLQNSILNWQQIVQQSEYNKPSSPTPSQPKNGDSDQGVLLAIMSIAQEITTLESVIRGFSSASDPSSLCNEARKLEETFTSTIRVLDSASVLSTVGATKIQLEGPNVKQVVLNLLFTLSSKRNILIAAGQGAVIDRTLGMFYANFEAMFQASTAKLPTWMRNANTQHYSSALKALKDTQNAWTPNQYGVSITGCMWLSLTPKARGSG